MIRGSYNVSAYGLDEEIGIVGTPHRRRSFLCCKGILVINNNVLSYVVCFSEIQTTIFIYLSEVVHIIELL